MAHAKYFLTTKRLGFREWSAMDLPLAIALWGDPEVTRRMGGPFSDDEIRNRLAAEIASMAARGVPYWPLFFLTNDDYVGCAGLRPYQLTNRSTRLDFICGRPIGDRVWPKRPGRRLLPTLLKHLG